MNKARKSAWILKSVIALVVFLTGALAFVNCYQAPVTGRNQFIIIPREQADLMGATAFQEVIQKERVSSNSRYNEAVRRVASRITALAETPKYNWEYKVIDGDDTINAFALPGGKIGVYTGILSIAKTDAGLATVLAHEVGHVAANHGAERVSAGILAQLGAVGLSLALKNRDPDAVNALMQAFGIGVGVGVILPFGRNQETEADKIGLIYMAKAGYDPRDAVAFWERMEAATKNKPRPPQFLSTHPGSGTRIANLKKWMPEALSHYERSKKAPNNVIVADDGDYEGDTNLASK
ncbi:MAG: M48 family metallopeptidase [Deltaproteobacteria bacterium]